MQGAGAPAPKKKPRRPSTVAQGVRRAKSVPRRDIFRKNVKLDPSQVQDRRGLPKTSGVTPRRKQSAVETVGGILGGAMDMLTNRQRGARQKILGNSGNLNKVINSRGRIHGTLTGGNPAAPFRSKSRIKRRTRRGGK